MGSHDENATLRNLLRTNSFEQDVRPRVVVDRVGTIMVVNMALEDLTGYARTELEGQPIEILVPMMHRDIHKQYRESYMAMKDPPTRLMGALTDLLCRKKDGTEIKVKIELQTKKLVDYGKFAEAVFV